MIFKSFKLPLFWRKATSVFSGTLIAQLIPLASSVLIARLFLPESFGVYATWLGLVMLATVLLTLRLEHAIAIEEPGEGRNVVAVAAIFISLVMMFFLSVIMCFFLFLSSPSIINLQLAEFTLIPVAALFLAIIQVWQSLLACEGQFRILIKARIFQTFTIAVFQIVSGLLAPEALSLVLAHLLGLLMSVLFLALSYKLPLVLMRETLNLILPVLRRHSKLPKWSLPADFINTSAAQLPLLVVSARFGAEMAGFLALTMRMLAGPVSILGGAMRDVFKEAASKNFRLDGNCSQIYSNVFKVLAAGAFLLAVAVYFTAEFMFGWFFGENWSYAGKIAVWMIPIFSLGLIASPLSYVIYLAEKQKFDLAWQVSLFCFTISTLNYFQLIDNTLVAYSCGYGFLYIVYLYMSYKFSKGRNR